MGLGVQCSSLSSYESQVRCRKPADSCRLAFVGGQSGNISLLKWLRNEVCPWDKETIWFAARNGRVDLMT